MNDSLLPPVDLPRHLARRLYDVFYPVDQPCSCPDTKTCNVRKSPANAWEVVYNKVCVQQGYLAPVSLTGLVQRPAFKRTKCAVLRAGDGRQGTVSVGSQVGTPAYLGTVLPLAALVVILATIAVRRSRAVVVRQISLQENKEDSAPIMTSSQV
jgi:hypothetical protein